MLFGVYRFYWHQNVSKYLQELELTQWLSTKEIKKLQWLKLKKLLEYAYTNVPYYRKMFETQDMHPKDIVTPNDFRMLPILNKEKITENLSEIVSLAYNGRDLHKNSTGGSTGVNLRFFSDKKEVPIIQALVLLNDRWAGLELGDKHVLLWGSPFDTSIQYKLKSRIINRMYRLLFLSSYNLSKEVMHNYAKKIIQYKPKVMIGYSSSLYLFAQFLEANKIENINLKSIISSAEVLYDYQRDLIESVFGCNVFNRYGSREIGAIAQECSEHSGMHINAEHVYVECLKDGEPAAPGERGELVITDLDNYGMPFVRYTIGDIGVLSDRKCKCGRGLPILEKVGGRTFDIIVGTNGRHFDGHFFSILLRTAIEGIKQFQVVQESKSKMHIKIVVDEVFKSEYIGMLTDKIHEYCGEDMQVNFNIVDEIKPKKSGKFRFVISKVPPDFGTHR